MTAHHCRRPLLALIVPVLLLCGASRALAQDGSTTGTVEVAVRSVTVSPDAFDFDNCEAKSGLVTGAVLTFPNGQCRPSETITVTNGNAPATIHVRATDFAGTGGGATWSLVDGAAPGVDEARLHYAFSFGGPPAQAYIDDLQTTNECDQGWEFVATGTPGCEASIGQEIEPTIILFGPEATTNPSSSFSTTITWTALP